MRSSGLNKQLYYIIEKKSFHSSYKKNPSCTSSEYDLIIFQRTNEVQQGDSYDKMQMQRQIIYKRYGNNEHSLLHMPQSIIMEEFREHVCCF